MKEQLRQLLLKALNAVQQAVGTNELVTDIQIDTTKDQQHGDYSANVAMILAKRLHKNPRELATLIVNHLPSSDIVQKVEIAGPGFINFFLKEDSFAAIVPRILTEQKDFGRSNLGQGKKLNIEFVSSNPTGPLHVGHGRGAAYGGALSDLLIFTGFNVHREYYVNDAGRQMSIITLSVYLRYLELLGLTLAFPSNGYQGDYVKDIAQALLVNFGEQLRVDSKKLFDNVASDLQVDGSGDKEAHVDDLIRNLQQLLTKDQYQAVFDITLQAILADIRADLADFGVIYQAWFSEKSLFDTNAIAHALAKLTANGHVYEQEQALWFRSTSFGDDKDRVLLRDNGQPTYFASDIAYLLNKMERGFDELFYIVGSDHHGYIPRIKAAAQAFGLDPNKIHFLIVQFAVLYRGKERVQMSTRSGSFVTLRELREEVGKDAARFFYVTRRTEQHMDFDLELAKSQSNDNPVYYLQYAHARICSVFRQANDKNMPFDQALGLENIASLTNLYEKALLTSLTKFPELIDQAAKAYEPHQIANYLKEVAHDFHTYYNAAQFLVPEAGLRNARLCLILATKQVLENGLTILGVSAPETM